jgi:hypothetical protein
MTTSDLPSSRFVVGGNGRRSGLAATKVGQVELRVLVLPKPWAKPSAHPSQSIAVTVGRSLTIIAREGQKFDVLFGDDDARTNDLRGCFEHLVNQAQRVAESRTEAEIGADDEDDDEALTRRLPLIGVSGRGGRPAKGSSGGKRAKPVPKVLLTVGKDNGADVVIDIQANVPLQETPECFATYWDAFQALWLHAGNLRELTEANIQPLGRMSASDIASLDLRLLLHVAFVRKVSELLRHARPGYVRVTKRSPFIRGLMNPISAAVVLAGGATTVECTYDEFGLDTPLHRVIVTALEEVCDAHQADSWLSQTAGPIADATWLRRQFEAVRTLPRTAALGIGLGLQSRMSKLDGDWATALDLACLVLEGRSLSPIPGSRSAALSWGLHEDNAFVFDISTESCWENLVRKYFGLKKRPEGKKSWKDLGKTKAPDGAIDGERIVFDAKYKKLDKTPATGDQHQSFVYSHLFKSDWALLVYPASTETGETEPSATPPRGQFSPRNDDGCCLGLIHMAFPGIEDVASRGAWVKFLVTRSDVAKDWLSKLQCLVAPGKP